MSSAISLSASSSGSGHKCISIRISNSRFITVLWSGWRGWAWVRPSLKGWFIVGNSVLSWNTKIVLKCIVQDRWAGFWYSPYWESFPYWSIVRAGRNRMRSLMTCLFVGLSLCFQCSSLPGRSLEHFPILRFVLEIELIYKWKYEWSSSLATVWLWSACGLSLFRSDEIRKLLINHHLWVFVLLRKTTRGQSTKLKRSCYKMIPLFFMFVCLPAKGWRCSWLSLDQNFLTIEPVAEILIHLMTILPLVLASTGSILKVTLSSVISIASPCNVCNW